MLTNNVTGMADATLAPGTVLSYDWSTDHGMVVVDGSGSGNDGTNYNTNVYSTDNGYKYRTFDTSGQHIEAPSSNTLNLSTITVEAIFSTSFSGVHQTICLKRDYPNNGYWYGVDVSGYFYFYVFNDGVDRSCLSNIYVSDGLVHDITVTYDGRYIKFYDFGVLKDTKDWVSLMPIGRSPSNFYVSAPAGEHPFVGSLYLLRVTNGALSPAQVAANANNDLGRTAQLPTPTPAPIPSPTPTAVPNINNNASNQAVDDPGNPTAPPMENASSPGFSALLMLAAVAAAGYIAYARAGVQKIKKK